jgi:predicted HTH domain antitoxin
VSKTLAMEMEDDVFPALQKEPAEMVREMRLAAAAKWYEMGLISQSKAAEIAGVSRAEFVSSLSRLAVSPFQESAEEIRKGLDQ